MGRPTTILRPVPAPLPTPGSLVARAPCGYYLHFTPSVSSDPSARVPCQTVFVDPYTAKLQKLLRDLDTLPPARQAEAKIALIASLLHAMSTRDLVEMWNDVVQLFGPDEAFADLIEGHLALREMFPATPAR